MKPLLIVGSYLSPYVRKVLVCLEIKGIAYEVDHIVPFFGDDRFSRLSPLRRIPVLVDGDLVLSDSSAICQYIEDKQPAPALLPADIRDRARARWLEEFADTRMGDVFIWRLFNQIAIRRSVWGEKGDRELVEVASGHVHGHDIGAFVDDARYAQPMPRARDGSRARGRARATLGRARFRQVSPTGGS